MVCRWMHRVRVVCMLCVLCVWVCVGVCACACATVACGGLVVCVVNGHLPVAPPPPLCAPTLHRLQRRAHMGFVYCGVCGRVVEASCVEAVCVLVGGG